MNLSSIKLKDFKPDEQVLVVARHHWFIFLRDLIGILLLFFLPFFAVPLLTTFLDAGGGPVTIPDGFGVFFASLWALLLWQMLFARWTDVYFDIWIVTNWRIIDIEQKGFFNRNIATLLNLDHIEDVTTGINSVIGTLLEYGDIQVQTAAHKNELIFKEAGKFPRLSGRSGTLGRPDLRRRCYDGSSGRFYPGLVCLSGRGSGLWFGQDRDPGFGWEFSGGQHQFLGWAKMGTRFASQIYFSQTCPAISFFYGQTRHRGDLFS